MSQLEVNKVIPQSGTTLTVGESGDTITIPSGATFDASNATTTLPSTVVTTTGTQTLTNKTIDASQLVDASVSNAKLANSSITLNGNAVSLGGTASIASGMFRNIIINGDMSIAQRGTSKANVGFEYGTVDRFQTLQGGLGQFTQTQDSDVPTGQGFAKSLKMACTTADTSPASGDELYIRQIFEGQNLQYLKKGTANAQSLTVSFWVKSNKTGTYIVELFDLDNSRHINKSYTINSADTWEQKTITYAGDTTGTFDNDNGASLHLAFMLGSGSDFNSGTLQTSWGTSTPANRQVGQVNLADSTSNYINITGVQLEAGTTASDFEFLPYDVNENRCLRYFEEFTGANTHGGLYSGSTYIGHLQYKVRKRTRPTLNNVTGNAYTSISNSSGGDKGGTDNMYFNGNANMYIVTLSIDAEL